LVDGVARKTIIKDVSSDMPKPKPILCGSHMFTGVKKHHEGRGKGIYFNHEKAIRR
jgi:hypothetical protein